MWFTFAGSAMLTERLQPTSESRHSAAEVRDQPTAGRDPRVCGQGVGCDHRPYPDVRTDIVTAEEIMFVTSTSRPLPSPAPGRPANTTLSQYNQRPG